MSDKPISPLRQRMIDDMTARRFTEDTQRDYVRNVRMFAAFLGRSPDTATKDDLRRFQLHMARQQFSPGSINAAIAALRFFFTVTLERPDLVRPLTIVNKPRRAPVVLSQEEVARLLEAAPGLKYKAALSVAYGAGLRVSEVANLKVSDIDSQRMTLRVEQGKGQRDRYVMLSPQLLELLRDWAASSLFIVSSGPWLLRSVTTPSAGGIFSPGAAFPDGHALRAETGVGGGMLYPRTRLKRHVLAWPKQVAEIALAWFKRQTAELE